MMEKLVDLVLLFFAFAFLGWCIEVTLKYFEFHRFINRGFLTGPWLPIYGFGAVLVTVFVKGLAPLDSGYGTTFAISFVLCGVLEYMTSYVMEKRFHARWWDYSRKPMNLHGRVWIGNLVLFGLGGVLIIHVLDPIFFRLFARMSLTTREIIAAVLTVVFTADYVVSHFVLKLVKTGVEQSQADSTEQISREVRFLLHNRSVFYRRFADAYPEVIYKTERINARLEAIRAETERLRHEAEQRAADVNQRLEAGKEQLAARLEPTGAIKNGVIEKQGALIALLYDDAAATEEMRGLKREIDADLERLQDRRGLIG
jgi:Predicted membrane protein